MRGKSAARLPKASRPNTDAYKGRLREKERRASLAELEADLQAAAKKQP